MAPVGSADARLLILGSLPGEASLAAQRYYAHPTNQFWRLLGQAIGEDLAALDYDLRLERLAERDIALWDVVAQARRAGSLDGAIRAATPNALADLRRDPSAAGGGRLQRPDGGGDRARCAWRCHPACADRPAVVQRGADPPVRRQGRQLGRARRNSAGVAPGAKSETGT